MKEEEEDKALLSSLGVTSADPEDIERDILEQVLLHIMHYVSCLFLQNMFMFAWTSKYANCITVKIYLVLEWLRWNKLYLLSLKYLLYLVINVKSN